MKRYVAVFVSFVLVVSTGPVFAGFIDTLKGLLPGHHDQPVRQHAQHPKAKSRANPKPSENPSPTAEASPLAGESPAPTPVPVPSAEPTVDTNQTAAADQSPKPVASPVTLQSSTVTAPSVAIDPPPLY
jgi:hypothetical protein